MQTRSLTPDIGLERSNVSSPLILRRLNKVEGRLII